MSRLTEVSPASCEGELPVLKTWSTEFVFGIPSELSGTKLRSGTKIGERSEPIGGLGRGRGYPPYRRGMALENKRSRGRCSCLCQLGLPCDFRSFAIFL